MFEVNWTEQTLDVLADIYVDSDLEIQHEMATALERLRSRLANHPLTEGESRAGDVRVIFVDHLLVRVRVNIPDRIVTITGVRRYGP